MPYSLRMATGPTGGFNTDPDFLSGENAINDQTCSIVTSAIFVDDIFDFYPYVNMAIADQNGKLTERLSFIEGMNVKILFGDFSIPNDEGILSHDFYWTQDQLKRTILTDHISGTHVWELVSKLRQDQAINSRAWGYSSAFSRGVSLKQVVLDVTEPYDFEDRIIHGVRDGVIVPGGITNKDVFYQPNIQDFEFLKKMMRIAHNDNNSPYVCFSNLKKEFYFTSIEQLESQQRDQANIIKMEPSELQIMEPDQVLRYDLSFGGSPFNENNYNSRFYMIDQTGAYNIEDNQIKNFFKSPIIQNDEFGRNRKYMVRGQYLGQLRSIRGYGFVDSNSQKENFKGWISSHYVNSMTANRMTIVGHFNPNAVAGKTYEVFFKEEAGSNKYSKLYAGKWTILRSEHHWSGINRKLSTKVYLFRSGLEIPDSMGDSSLAKVAGDF